MAAYRARLKEFEDVIGEEEIDLYKLKSICFNGIPEEQVNRALCWRLMLNYLPPDRRCWEDVLARKRKLYSQFVDEMIVNPGESCIESGERVDVTMSDHPLSCNPDSLWGTYFKDNEVLLQIDKDVRRLCPDISFFQQPTEFPCSAVVNSGGEKRLHSRVQHSVLKSANVERKGLGITRKMEFETIKVFCNNCGVEKDIETFHYYLIDSLHHPAIALSRRKAPEDYAPLPEGSEAHWEVVQRVLFLYAKLNPGQGYVQGMNEIVGPIYHVFASDPHHQWREHAEADCFFAFTNLMAEIRDFFIKSLDETESGINMLMDRLCSELKRNDHEVYMKLQEQELRPQYYSFRWLTLLLSQEFPLPDVLRIWDSLLADTQRFSFLIYVCCAMIILLRDQILKNDFPSNVKLLQSFPSIDIQIVLSKAVELADLKK